MRKIWGFFLSGQRPEGGPMQMSSSVLTPCGNAIRAHSSQRGNGLLRGWERSLYCRSFSTVVKLASGRLVGVREVVVLPPPLPGNPPDFSGVEPSWACCSAPLRLAGSGRWEWGQWKVGASEQGRWGRGGQKARSEGPWGRDLGNVTSGQQPAAPYELGQLAAVSPTWSRRQRWLRCVHDSGLSAGVAAGGGTGTGRGAHHSMWASKCNREPACLSALSPGQKTTVAI